MRRASADATDAAIQEIAGANGFYTAPHTPGSAGFETPAQEFIQVRKDSQSETVNAEQISLNLGKKNTPNITASVSIRFRVEGEAGAGATEYVIEKGEEVHLPEDFGEVLNTSRSGTSQYSQRTPRDYSRTSGNNLDLEKIAMVLSGASSAPVPPPPRPPAAVGPRAEGSSAFTTPGSGELNLGPKGREIGVLFNNRNGWLTPLPPKTPAQIAAEKKEELARRSRNWDFLLEDEEEVEIKTPRALMNLPNTVRTQQEPEEVTAPLSPRTPRMPANADQTQTCADDAQPPMFNADFTASTIDSAEQGAAQLPPGGGPVGVLSRVDSFKALSLRHDEAPSSHPHADVTETLENLRKSALTHTFATHKPLLLNRVGMSMNNSIAGMPVKPSAALFDPRGLVGGSSSRDEKLLAAVSRGGNKYGFDFSHLNDDSKETAGAQGGSTDGASCTTSAATNGNSGFAQQLSLSLSARGTGLGMMMGGSLPSARGGQPSSTIASARSSCYVAPRPGEQLLFPRRGVTPGSSRSRAPSAGDLLANSLGKTSDAGTHLAQNPAMLAPANGPLQLVDYHQFRRKSVSNALQAEREAERAKALAERMAKEEGRKSEVDAQGATQGFEIDDLKAKSRASDNDNPTRPDEETNPKPARRRAAATDDHDEEGQRTQTPAPAASPGGQEYVQAKPVFHNAGEIENLSHDFHRNIRESSMGRPSLQSANQRPLPLSAVRVQTMAMKELPSTQEIFGPGAMISPRSARPSMLGLNLGEVGGNLLTANLKDHARGRELEPMKAVKVSVPHFSLPANGSFAGVNGVVGRQISGTDNNDSYPVTYRMKPESVNARAGA
eukprot:g10585.t1